MVVQSRDGNKGSYEESSRKINNSNSRLYGEVSKEDNVSEAPALRGNSTGSHSDRRDVDMSPAKGPVSSFLTPLHSNDTLHNIKMQGSSSNSAYYGDRGREDQSHPFTVNGLSTPQELQHLRSVSISFDISGILQ